MSASRCLLPFVKAVIHLPMTQWKRHIEALPETCPHGDCNAPLNCRKRCRDFALAQWEIRKSTQKKAA